MPIDRVRPVTSRPLTTVQVVLVIAVRAAGVVDEAADGESGRGVEGVEHVDVVLVASHVPALAAMHRAADAVPRDDVLKGKPYGARTGREVRRRVELGKEQVRRGEASC